MERLSHSSGIRLLIECNLFESEFKCFQMVFDKNLLTLFVLRSFAIIRCCLRNIYITYLLNSGERRIIKKIWISLKLNNFIARFKTNWFFFNLKNISCFFVFSAIENCWTFSTLHFKFCEKLLPSLLLMLSLKHNSYFANQVANAFVQFKIKLLSFIRFVVKNCW